MYAKASMDIMPSKIELSHDLLQSLFMYCLVLGFHINHLHRTLGVKFDLFSFEGNLSGYSKFRSFLSSLSLRGIFALPLTQCTLYSILSGTSTLSQRRRNRSRTVAIEVCLLFNFAVVFTFNLFSFPPSKAQSIGDVPMNRKNAANCLF
jgi:hypothetical protein